MKLAYTCSLNIDESFQEIIKDISHYSGKFYNMALYEMKHNNHLSLYAYYVLFKSSYGYFNSDINGSLNILRKIIHEKNIPRLIELVRDKGFRDNPIRLLTI